MEKIIVCKTSLSSQSKGSSLSFLCPNQLSDKGKTFITYRPGKFLSSIPIVLDKSIPPSVAYSVLLPKLQLADVLSPHIPLSSLGLLKVYKEKPKKKWNVVVVDPWLPFWVAVRLVTWNRPCPIRKVNSRWNTSSWYLGFEATNIRNYISRESDYCTRCRH